MDWNVMLWREKTARASPAFGAEVASDAPQWAPACCLRGHCADVHSLAWAPRSASLLSGDLAGATIVWNLEKAKPQQILTEHEHYVQGVAWDPLDQHLVSVSCDRTVKVYSSQATAKGGALLHPAAESSVKTDERDYSCHTVITKRTHAHVASARARDGDESAAAPVPSITPVVSVSPPSDNLSAASRSVKVPLFLDDSVNSFYRRPDWSPEGSFLLLPCGQFYANDQPTTSGEYKPTTYVFSRNKFTAPSAHLPSPDKPVIAVRCCPVLYEHRRGTKSSTVSPTPRNPTTTTADASTASQSDWMASLPYRVLWAAATLDSILVYDSASKSPLAIASNVHYAPLTDLTWLPDGHGLVASAGDGYCTILRFRPQALGTQVPLSKLPACMQKMRKILQVQQQPISTGISGGPAKVSQLSAIDPTILQGRIKQKAEAPAVPVASLGNANTISSDEIVALRQPKKRRIELTS